MKTRISLSVLVGILWAVAQWIWGMIYIPMQAQVAMAQLNDDAMSYGASRWFITADRVAPAITVVALILLGVIWLKAIRNIFRNAGSKSLLGAFALLFFFSMITSGCVKPPRVEPIEEIAPNETAFVIPLEGSTDAQASFASEKYLRNHQVAAKRVVIPVRERKIGRYSWNIEWIPTVRVIKVDRSPETREWVSAEDKGTSKSNQAFGVESSESIDFEVGMTCSALITEENAARFLYYYAGRPLDQIMDENVRGFFQAYLFQEFGGRTLAQGQIDKPIIFQNACDAAKENFANMGITITACGGSEGLVYNDKQVQAEITKNFTAEQARKRAEAALQAQKIENERIISEATAKAEAKKKAAILEAEGKSQARLLEAQAEAKAIEMTGKMLNEYPEYIDQTLAQQWKGLTPQTLFTMRPDGGTPPFIWDVSPAQTTPGTQPTP